jgi:hypothetical protein
VPPGLQQATSPAAVGVAVDPSAVSALVTLAAVLAGKGSGEVHLVLPKCWCPCCLPLLCQQPLDLLLCLVPENRAVLDDSCGAQWDDATGPAWTVHK